MRSSDGRSSTQWDDLKDLMRVRVPRGNCRTRDEGASDLFTDVWQEI